jgi:hypothetical protein
MASNLNEKCLLRFLGQGDEKPFGKGSEIVRLLKQFNITVKANNFNELHNIIDEWEDE